jgi:hypothetical protein
MSDQSTPAVQPGGDAEGQGDQEITGSGLYDLDSAPEQYRPFIEAELKKIEGNVTKRFQDAKEFREQWEPYSAIEGLTDVPPEDLQELLQLREIAQDPEAFDHWIKQMAEHRGLLNSDEPEGGDDEDYEDDDEGGVDLSKPSSSSFSRSSSTSSSRSGNARSSRRRGTPSRSSAPSPRRPVWSWMPTRSPTS